MLVRYSITHYLPFTKWQPQIQVSVHIQIHLIPISVADLREEELSFTTALPVFRAKDNAFTLSGHAGTQWVLFATTLTPALLWRHVHRL